MNELIGRQLRGYEFREELGRGGYGAVYRAFQPAVGRDVAIKIILPEHAENPEFTQRFEREAQLVAQLEHPYIVPLYDYWQDENGAFLVMRWIRGGSLRQYLEQQGPLDLKRLVRIFDHIGSALQVSHGEQVVHRDIKPDNILLDQYDNTYLTDFGIAKQTALNQNLTADEDVVGTPAYISPEQIQSQAISAQTDIYALGIMLYELVTGKIPFDKPGLQIVMAHLQDPLPSVLEVNPALPEALDDVIMTAAAKTPDQRYQDVMEMVDAIREIYAPVAQPILPPDAQPVRVDPNRHVFISYSRADSQFVQRMVYDLQTEGVAVWVDQRGLKPGTRNWEDALRNAIQSAYAVILIASPASRRSAYVQDELAIAEMYSAPVYPVWADGDEWIDSIPMGRGKMQYIDARGSEYDKALLELVMILGGRGGEDLVTTDPSMVISADFEPRNPYKGLRAFRQQDQGDFFGRETLVTELIENLESHMQPHVSRLLSVIGPSGSGKSSVIMAGLLPALESGALPGSDDWVYLPPFVPGTNPIENLLITLSAALPEKSHTAIREDLQEPAARGLHTLARQIIGQRGSRIVLYIDQFEELFTQTESEADRQQFINLLLIAVSEPGGPLTAILSLRADFYDRPMNYPELGKLIESNSKSVLPMALHDLYSVVQKPAELDDVRLMFDPGLVAELVFEVRDQAGSLPLLQFTLEQLFERREGRRMTLAAYQEIGGVRGALAKHAEQTYEDLPDDDHRRMTRALFIRLIEPGTTEQDTTRRRAPRSELVLDDAAQTQVMDGVIEAFVSSRLLLTDQHMGVNTIEVSHEALIREWPRLSEWLSDARADIITQQNITADTDAWIARGRSPEDDGLYRGTLLEDAQEWAWRNVPSRNEMDFINASVTQQAARQAKDEAIARRVQNFGRAAIVLGVMAALAVIATIVAFNQSSTAQSQVNTATIAQGLANQARQTSDVQVQNAVATLTPIPRTLTPIGETLVAGLNLVATSQVEATNANLLAGEAQTQVAVSGQTLTPVPQTLTPVALTLQGAEDRLNSAEDEIASANLQAQEAQTQVAFSGLTLTPIPQTLTPISSTLVAAQDLIVAANTDVADADSQLESARTQVAVADFAAQLAETQVAQANATLTPVPQTLTPVALTLEGAQERLNDAENQILAANLQAQEAQTQVANSGLTLTPIPQTLTPIGATLVAANLEVETARTEVANSGLTLTPIPQTLTPVAGTLVAAGELVVQANTEVAAAAVQLESARTQIANADLEAAGAQTQVAHANETLTPVPLTLTPVGATLAAANLEAESARTEVAISGLTLTPVPQTLTPVAITIAAANEQLAAANELIQAAELEAAGAQTQVAQANESLTPVPLTLTPVGATLEAANEQVRGAQTLVAVAEQTLEPLEGTLVAAQLIAAQSASQALSQSLAVSADQAISNDNYDLALVLALESININPDLVQAQRTLYELVSDAARFSFDDSPLVEFSPSVPRLVTVENGSELVMWDIETRRALFTMSGHDGAINAVAFSPNGAQLVSAGDNGQVILWNASSGAEIRRFEGHSGPVNAVDFSPDGGSILSGGQDNQNIVWAVADGSQRAVRSLGNDRPITRVHYFADGQRFYSWELAGDEPIMVLWNINRTNALWTSPDPIYDKIDPRLDRYTLNEFESPTRLRVYEGSNLSVIRNFNLENGELIQAAGFNPVNSNVVSASIIGASEALKLSEFDLGNGSRIKEFEITGVGQVNDLAVSPDGSVAAIGADGFIVLWNLNDGVEVRRLGAHNDVVQDIAFSPDGLYLRSRSGDGNIRVWDVTRSDPAQVRRIRAVTANNTITDPGIHPDGSAVYAALRVDMFAWNLNNGQQINRVLVAGNIINAVYSPTVPHVLTIFPDTAVIWDMSRPPEQARVRFMGSENDSFGVLTAGPNGESIYRGAAAAYSPDGQFVVMDGRTLSVRDINTNGRIADMDESNIRDGHGVTSVAMTTDNRLVLGATGDLIDADARPGDIFVWDALTGQEIRRFGSNQHNRRINHIAISPDGAQVLSASNDNTLILWDIETGQLVRRLAGHRGAVVQVFFTAGGTQALSSSADGTVILWDLGAGQLLRRYSGTGAPITGMAVNSETSRFVTTTGGDTLIVWQIEPIEEVVQWTVENRYIAQLSCDEAAQYQLNPAGCTNTSAIRIPTIAAPTATTPTATLAPGETPQPTRVGPTASPTSTPVPEACFVRTSADAVPIRVGPGINRTTRSFMPMNRDVIVTGQFVETDGTRWFRIEPPGFNEIERDRFWVAEANVVTQGDCDAIEVTSGSPIQRAQPTRPPITPTADGAGPQPTEDTGDSSGCSVPISPVGPGQLGTGLVLFSWTAAPQADRYFIIVSDATNGNVVFNDATSNTSANLETGSWPDAISWTIAAQRGGSPLCSSATVTTSR